MRIAIAAALLATASPCATVAVAAQTSLYCLADKEVLLADDAGLIVRDTPNYSGQYYNFQFDSDSVSVRMCENDHCEAWKKLESDKISAALVDDIGNRYIVRPGGKTFSINFMDRIYSGKCMELDQEQLRKWKETL